MTFPELSVDQLWEKFVENVLASALWDTEESMRVAWHFAFNEGAIRLFGVYCQMDLELLTDRVAAAERDQ